jgi:glycosyltransferase involved in cell wall biosynthesis
MENKENELLVSVIIPTYNRGDFLRDALKSVVNQTYKNLEILVIDDFSTEDIQSVVLEFNNDQRVNYLKNLNSKGPQGARNTGLRLASGEWIAMLDSDDVWLEKKIEVQINETKEKNGLVGIGCGFSSWDSDFGKIMPKKIFKNGFIKKRDILKENFLGGFSVFMFKKEVGIKCGGFDSIMPSMQDVDFYVRLLDFGEIYLLPETLTLQRVSNLDRITTNYYSKKVGLSLLIKKNEILINSDLKLKAQMFSNLMFREWRIDRLKSIRLFPWLIILLLFDFRFALSVLRNILNFEKTQKK